MIPVNPASGVKSLACMIGALDDSWKPHTKTSRGPASMRNSVSKCLPEVYSLREVVEEAVGGALASSTNSVDLR
jgi:hypothetical protein